MAFLFHTAPLGGYKYNADEEKLSNQMITYWTNLAKYGDPNGESDMSWPRYTHQTKNVLRFLTPENKVSVCNNYFSTNVNIYNVEIVIALYIVCHTFVCNRHAKYHMAEGEGWSDFSRNFWANH